MGKEFPANKRNSSFQNLLMPKYVSLDKVREVFDISPETRRGWAVTGVVNVHYPGGAAKHRSAVVGGRRTKAQETHDEQEAEEGHTEEQEDAGEDCESAAEEV
ncbi:hypothetical protein PC110_g23248, partial [Phytophthora cactorum]